jgi:hypothetical protein
VLSVVLRLLRKPKSLVIETAWSRSWREPSDSLKPEYDLLVAIAGERELLQQMAPEYQRNKWVKGHQEETTPYHKLSFESRLNIEADQLATEAIESVESRDKLLQVTGNGYCRAYLLNGSVRQTRDETTTLQNKRRELVLQDYYIKRLKLDKGVLHEINWAAIRMARERMSVAGRKYAIKLTIGWLPSGSRLHLFGEEVVS